MGNGGPCNAMAPLWPVGR